MDSNILLVFNFILIILCKFLDNYWANGNKQFRSRTWNIQWYLHQ